MSTRTRRRPSIFLLERYLMASLALLSILLIETAYLHASLEHHLRTTTTTTSATANDGSSSTALLVFQHESQARRTTNHAIPASPWLWKKSTGSDASHQVVKKDKNGKVVHHSITKLTAAELGSDTTTSSSTTSHVVSMEEAMQGRERLLALLNDAGVHDTEPAALAQLPKWHEIAALYYTTSTSDTDVTDQGPVIVGLDTCAQFRNSVPPEDASIGVAGLFNTGTNPLAMYLAANCVMPHSNNKHDHGMRWQVPWGKHMLAQRKWNNTAAHDQNVDKSHVLPVVLVRDPYTWGQSMCKHPYAAKWKHGEKHCPNFVNEKDGSSVNVSIGYPGQTGRWDSLVHLWSDWYNQYLTADYPRLLVRFEDMIFRPKEVINEICTCAGAVAKQDTFSYVVDAGKWGGPHVSSNMLTAIQKYGSARHRFDGLTPADEEFARLHLDGNLMQLFQYQMGNPGASATES